MAIHKILELFLASAKMHEHVLKIQPDSAAAQRVLAGRRQREDAVGMWHDAFTEERVQQRFSRPWFALTFSRQCHPSTSLFDIVLILADGKRTTWSVDGGHTVDSTHVTL